MRQVPRRHTATRTVPWCTCKFDRQRGFVANEQGLLVHAPCGKPAKMYWENRVAGRTA